jgi:hypothetical protein
MLHGANIVKPPPLRRGGGTDYIIEQSEEGQIIIKAEKRINVERSPSFLRINSATTPSSGPQSR